MTCPECRAWVPPDPDTGYDADDLCPDCAATTPAVLCAWCEHIITPGRWTDAEPSITSEICDDCQQAWSEQYDRADEADTQAEIDREAQGGAHDPTLE